MIQTQEETKQSNTSFGQPTKPSPVQYYYSYLMGVDAIDQSICPEVLGMTKCSIA